jgi:hypothetical protein
MPGPSACYTCTETEFAGSPLVARIEQQRAHVSLGPGLNTGSEIDVVELGMEFAIQANGSTVVWCTKRQTVRHRLCNERPPVFDQLNVHPSNGNARVDGDVAACLERGERSI